MAARGGRRGSKDVEAPVETVFSQNPTSHPSSSWSSVRRPPPPAEEPSQDLDEAPCWVDPKKDLVGFLYHHKIYNCVNPFENLTELWLETGDKFADDGEVDEEEEEAKKKAAQEREPSPAAVAKAEAIKRQLQASTGHIIFMRGRDLRCELVDQVEKRRLQRDDSKLLSSTASQSSAQVRPTGSLSSDAGIFWYLAPKYPKGAMKAGVVSPKKRKNWAWRSDFVQEALHAAIGMGMDRPVVDAAAASRAVRRSPEAALALRDHVAVRSTDRHCELWSPSFLQSLDVLRKIWDFGGTEVRLEEQELAANFPEVMGIFAHGNTRDHSPFELKLPEPKAFLQKRPFPPPLQVPDRLPTKLAYRFSHMRPQRQNALPVPQPRGPGQHPGGGRAHPAFASERSLTSASEGLQVAAALSLGFGSRYRPSSGRSMSHGSARSSKRVSFAAYDPAEATD